MAAVVCMSNPGIFIDEDKATRVVQDAAGCRVLGGKFLWNSGVALFLLQRYPRFGDGRRLQLKQLAAETGEMPCLEMSIKQSIDLPHASEYLNVRFIVVNPEKDLPKSEEMGAYNRAYNRVEQQWQHITASHVDEMIRAAGFVCGEAGLLFDSFHVPQRSFGIGTARGGSTRLYGQLFLKFSRREEAERLLAMAGTGRLRCNLRGFPCVARVERMSGNQIRSVQRGSWLWNPNLLDDGCPPPPLEDEAPGSLPPLVPLADAIPNGKGTSRGPSQSPRDDPAPIVSSPIMLLRENMRWTPIQTCA
eukprot:Hpha_TRINITY_DN15295_c2_g2::TRINITY_DN15295_c2_g2_i2::g.68418::m.68418